MHLQFQLPTACSAAGAPPSPLEHHDLEGIGVCNHGLVAQGAGLVGLDPLCQRLPCRNELNGSKGRGQAAWSGGEVASPLVMQACAAAWHERSTGSTSWEASQEGSLQHNSSDLT